MLAASALARHSANRESPAVLPQTAIQCFSRFLPWVPAPLRYPHTPAGFPWEGNANGLPYKYPYRGSKSLARKSFRRGDDKWHIGTDPIGAWLTRVEPRPGGASDGA